MTEFDTVLKRSFAEAHVPADDGFSVAVGAAVVRRERAAKLGAALQAAALTVAGAAAVYALFPLLWTAGQDLLTSFGLGMANAQFALHTEVPTLTSRAQGMAQTLSAAMGQIMLITAVLAGGAVAYRATQD
jgi:hypothetical protein